MVTTEDTSQTLMSSSSASSKEDFVSSQSRMMTRRSLTQTILTKVERGSTYLDAITSAAREFRLDETQMASLLEDSIKRNLEVEARTLRLIK